MVLVQKWPFFQTFFFQAMWARKMSFTIFYNEKTPFQAIKTKSSKSRKIHIFPTGLTHAFGPKMAIFPNFFFLGNIGKENFFYDILERKNSFLGYKNNKFKKSKKSHFYKGVNSWFLFKNDHYSNLFLLAIQARRMSYWILQNEKTPFYAIKTRNSKSRKIDIFPNRLTHGFGPKITIFPTFFVSQYRPRKVLLQYSRTKKSLSRL